MAVLDDLECKIFFVGQPWWPTFEGRGGRNGGREGRGREKGRIYSTVTSSNHNEIKIHYRIQTTLEYSIEVVHMYMDSRDLFALSLSHTALRNIMASLSGTNSIGNHA